MRQWDITANNKNEKDGFSNYGIVISRYDYGIYIL